MTRRLIAFAAFALSLPLQAQIGQEIYDDNCAVCHEVGLDRAPDRTTLALMAPDRILYALERGGMVSMAVTLSTDQRRSVSEYLAGQTLGSFTRVPPASAHCREADDYQAGRPVWQGWSGSGLANHRYQSWERAEISASDVGRLDVKWAFGFPGDIRANSPPTIAGGRLFLGSLGGGVYSLDAETGCVHWFLDVGASVRSPMTMAFIEHEGETREVVFFGDGTANVYAVDSATGEIIWRTEVDDFPVAHVAGSTVYHDGKVFVGVGSGEEGAAASPDYACCRFRGSLLALDAATGAMLWKTYMVDEPTPRDRNAVGTQLWGPSGAPIWSSPAVDPERNTVYVTTGNNYSNPASAMSDAFVAVDVDSGRILWSRQTTEGDAWTAACRLEDKTNCADLTAPDFDFAASPILVDRPDGGSLLIAGQKSGVVHALDPDREGAIVWQQRVALGGSMGGVQWGSATDGERLYVAISDVRRIPVQHSWATEADPEIGGGVIALDLDDGQAVWYTPPLPCGDRPRCSPAQPGAVTVIDGVAFAGSMTGHLRAYSTDDGRVLYEFDSVRSYDTVNGVPASGGAIDGAGPTIANGILYLNSGYPNGGGMPGNVLIALSVNGE
ncbi:MAG TPA: PQQ-binding-like beta-propeller repeat protein [Gammaproteobacteria bacterium]|nr:PQQ-binding-like beta-propeller repeat protein [Gammaproteobacteria bacterium]